MTGVLTRRLGHRDAQAEDHVNTQRKDGHLKATETGLY